jgi:hypothetical protein
MDAMNEILKKTQRTTRAGEFVAQQEQSIVICLLVAKHIPTVTVPV